MKIQIPSLFLISDKKVGEKLQKVDNNAVELSDVEDDVNHDIYNYPLNNNNAEIERVNEMYPESKEVHNEHTNNEGQSKLYEYDFNGFEKAKSLQYKRILNRNKIEHF